MEEEETRQPSLYQWINIGMERTEGANKSDFLFFIFWTGLLFPASAQLL